MTILIFFMSITKVQVGKYCLGSDFHTYIRTPVPPKLSPPAKVYDAVASFRKGIKRDPTLFATFRDESNFDNWQRLLVSTARTQAVDKVLDHDYTPSTPEDRELFDEMQKYM